MLVLTLLLALHPLSFGEGPHFVNPPQTSEKSANSIRGAYVRGEKALQAGDLNTAEKAFQEVLTHEPNDPGANANLGVIYMRRQQWPTALHYLKAAERLAPNLAGIRLNLGLVYYRQSEYPKAIAPFASVVRQERKLLQPRYLRS